jgi:hypothetical protein
MQKHATTISSAIAADHLRLRNSMVIATWFVACVATAVRHCLSNLIDQFLRQWFRSGRAVAGAKLQRLDTIRAGRPEYLPQLDSAVAR